LEVVIQHNPHLRQAVRSLLDGLGDENKEKLNKRLLEIKREDQGLSGHPD